MKSYEDAIAECAAMLVDEANNNPTGTALLLGFAQAIAFVYGLSSSEVASDVIAEARKIREIGRAQAVRILKAARSE